ncbi:MAG: PDZ domain-containing protein [Chloroflexi bacterium]|nr:PDZ domain-containing protein [Chloroflexota bacterium]
METRTNWTLWIILGAILVLLISCAAGALAGGVAGYLAAKSMAQRLAEAAPSEVPPIRVPWPLDRKPESPTPEIPWPEAMPMRPGAALVVQVVEDSPAERAGIRVGDIILAVDGQNLSEELSLTEAIAEHDPGDRIELTIFRQGRERTVEVRLGRHPERGGETPWLGVTYQTLGGRFRFDEMPRRFNFEFEIPGQEKG